MHKLRRKVLIPSFNLTEVCDVEDNLAQPRLIKLGSGKETFTYHIRSVINPITLRGYDYNLLPLVLDKNSAPWGVATMFVLSKLEGDIDLATIKSLADDLGAFKEWLDCDDNPDRLLVDFSRMKQRRVTYRYRGELKRKVDDGSIASSTAARRMSSIIAFYRWLIKEGLLEPENTPWEERTFNLALKNAHGRQFNSTIKSTDLRISVAKADDPFDGMINDEGKLRPLTLREQKLVMQAAVELGNGEMFFILLFMMLTGARVQTAGTLRVRDFMRDKVAFSQGLTGISQVYKLKAGPGTGIDTKRDKIGVLQIPRLLYESLCTYAVSERATHRRRIAPGGDHENQYLFLTQQGSPYYTAKEEMRRFNPDLTRRHHKTGGTIRQFMTDRLIPHIRKNYDSKFKFQLHDLRATFGMNQTDVQMALVHAGKISLLKARTNVMALMWHTSSATTERYLDYRKHTEAAYAAVNDYGDLVQQWIGEVMKGVDYN